MSDWLYCFQLIVLKRGVGLREVVDIADQIVGSGFSSIELRNKAVSIPQLIVISKICLATGARISEALTLTRSQVAEFKLTYTETKGKRNRSVPISPSLYQEILDIAVSDHEIFNTSYKDA